MIVIEKVIGLACNSSTGYSAERKHTAASSSAAAEAHPEGAKRSNLNDQSFSFQKLSLDLEQALPSAPEFPL